MPPIIVSVQGNIGSGKSTLLDQLKTRMGNTVYNKDCNKLSVCFLKEPVDTWNTIVDENATPILTLYYADQQKYAFTFQMMAYISRLALIKKAIKDGFDIIISERSLATDKNVFAKMLYDDKKINKVEYSIYLKWFDEFQSEFPQENIIYVKTSPTIANRRVLERARDGEIIPIEYLENCDKYHEDWLKHTNKEKVITLDGNINTKLNPNVIDNWVSDIFEFLKI